MGVLDHPIYKAQLSEAHCDSVLRCLLFLLARVTRSCWAQWLILTVCMVSSTVCAFPDTDHLRTEMKVVSETSFLNCTLDHCFITSGPQNNGRRSARNRGIHTRASPMKTLNIFFSQFTEHKRRTMTSFFYVVSIACYFIHCYAAIFLHDGFNCCNALWCHYWMCLTRSRRVCYRTNAVHELPSPLAHLL